MNKNNVKDYLPLILALAEGKTVQYKLGDGWSTGGDVDFTLPADQYRIKPEPREIWVNEYPNFKDLYAHTTQEGANQARNGRGITRHYREVIE